MNKTTPVILLIIGISGIAAMHTQRVSAADITMSPSYVRLDLAKETQTEITYTNKTDQPITLEFSAKNIDTQQYPAIRFFTDPQKNAESVANWVQYDKNTLTVPSKKSDKIKLSFSSDLSPGGHYAVLIANMKAENNIQPTAKEPQIALQAMLVTPLFIRAKDGKRDENIELKNIDTAALLLQFPKEIQFLVTNKGNIESVPYGKITINGWFSKNIAQGVINEGSAFLLPASSRRFSSKLTNSNQIIVPGIYTITGSLRYSAKSLEIDKWFFTTGNGNFYLIIIAVISFPFGLYHAIKKFKKQKTSPHYADVD